MGLAAPRIDPGRDRMQSKQERIGENIEWPQVASRRAYSGGHELDHQ
jgi:hypothetical protein